jgi:hypothetical protein
MEHEMSFSIYDYPSSQRAAEAERAAEYAARYACHADGCGDAEDTNPCDECGAYLCLHHLTDGLCAPCLDKAKALGLVDFEETTGISVEGIAEPLAGAIRGFLNVYTRVTGGKKAA